MDGIRTYWLTGLSGSGKSTLAQALKQKIGGVILDGDVIRTGLCSDLGFSEQDRQENIRRLGEVCKLFNQAGITVITAFISPYRKDRDKARDLLKDRFIEIYCNSSLETCEIRDVKGLYKKARSGEIPYFTGIDSPYEPPLNPEINLDTENTSINECINEIVNYG